MGAKMRPLQFSALTLLFFSTTQFLAEANSQFTTPAQFVLHAPQAPALPICQETYSCLHGSLAPTASTCHCDELCSVMNDCCSDIHASNSNLSSLTGRFKDPQALREAMHCRSYSNNDPITSRTGDVLMVMQCPKDYPNNTLRELCEITNHADSFLDYPVSGRRTGLLYRNKYCSGCWGDHDTLFWKLSFSCEQIMFDGFVQTEVSRTTPSLPDSETCRDEYHYKTPFSDEDANLRDCSYSTYHSTCASDFTNEKVIEECSNSTVFVISFDSFKMYKNPSCAVCNHEKPYHISCMLMKKEKPYIPTKHGPGVISLSFLFNLNENTMTDVRNKANTKISCSTNEILDPFSNRCRPLICPEEFMSKGGTCQQSSKSSIQSRGDGLGTEMKVHQLAINQSLSSDVQDVVGIDDIETNKANPPAIMTKPISGQDNINFLQDGGDNNLYPLELDSGFGEIINLLRNRTLLLPNGLKNIVNRDNSVPPATNVTRNALINKKNPPADDICAGMRLNQSDFLILENGTALHRKSGIPLRAEDYRLVEDFIVICEKALKSLTGTTGALHKPVESAGMAAITPSSVLTITAMSISIIALFLLILIYVLLPKLRNVPGKVMMMLAISLLLAQLLFLAGVNQTQHRTLCIVIAAIIHYFYSTSFAWMSCMAFDVTITFSALGAFQMNSRRNFKFIFYSLFSWLYPATLVAVALMLDLIWGDDVHPYNPAYGNHFCWISNTKGLLILFVIPVGLHLLANLIMFVVTVCNLRKAANATKKVRKGNPANVWISLKLALVMGGTWITAYVWIMTGFTIVVLEYIYIVLNSLQGLFIFVAFACRPNVWKLLRERMYGERFGKKRESSAYKISSTSSTFVTTK